MKKILCLAYATTIFGGFSSMAQTTSNGAVLNAVVQTVPANISQFQVGGRLITQNTFAGVLPAADPRITGNFGPTARWNSMGNLTAAGTYLNGFRTQTNGRALTSGFKVPSTGIVSNPFIEWIGNSGLLPAVTPGDMEFRWAASPTGGVSNLLFVMRPATPTVPGFAYADGGNFVGHKFSGNLGSFGLNDGWSATGLVGTPSFRIYGHRHQFLGYTNTAGLINNGIRTDAFMDFGNNQPGGTGGLIFKFRAFTDPANPASNRNVWQSNTRSANIVLGRQDYAATNNSTFYMSLFDGPTSFASNTVLNFVRRAGIYGCTDGNDEFGSPLGSYASIVGDISGAPATGTHYGVLGIAEGNYTGGPANGKWAGYFIGDVEITGALSFVSDRKFKTAIKDEENIMSKIMLLKPKNYLFDIVKNKNMALSNKLQHGLISQEVEEVFPELVQESFAPGTSADKNEDGKPVAYKGLNYIGLIPVLLKGIQEQEIKMQAQQVQIEELKKQLAGTSVSNTLVLTEKNSLNLPAEIENKAFSLSQNSPNPFSERTTITYSLPTDVAKAVLGVFDLNGKMLLQFNLQAGKNQQVQVSGNTLSAGMYIYSIIAGGQEVISKRMILTK